MSRNIRVSEPSEEMQIKIIRAKDAIASQKPRTVRCPYCRHNSIIVFEDTRGHVQTKAIKTIKGKISDIGKMKVEEQRKAVRSGYDPDILPPDLITFSKDAAELLADFLFCVRSMRGNGQ